MNNRIKNFLQITFGLLFIAIIGFLVYKGINYFFVKIDKINPNIVVAIIAGTVTITGYFITRYFEKKKIIEQQIREQKLPAYEEFIDFIFNIFKLNKNNRSIKDKDLQEFFWKMNKKSILWLSDKTLKSYANWRKLATDYSKIEKASKEEGIMVMLALGDLLLDFRKDIGHKNNDIESGDVLSLFLNDYYEYFK